MKWMDATFRPAAEPEVKVEPDGTVEIVFTEGTSALTLLLTPEQAKMLRSNWLRTEEGIHAGNRG